MSAIVKWTSMLLVLRMCKKFGNELNKTVKQAQATYKYFICIYELYRERWANDF